MRGVRARAVVAAAILVAVIMLGSSGPAMASVNSGSLQLIFRDHELGGTLANAVLQSDGSISMTMSVDGSFHTSIGPVPVTAAGQWEGRRNGSTVSGPIQNVVGTLHACFFFFWCGKANFIGQGQWSGSLAGSEATGTFDGTITFTSSDFYQIPVNEPQQVSGTWNANFQLPGN